VEGFYEEILLKLKKKLAKNLEIKIFIHIFALEIEIQ